MREGGATVAVAIHGEAEITGLVSQGGFMHDVTTEVSAAASLPQHGIEQLKNGAQNGAINTAVKTTSANAAASGDRFRTAVGDRVFMLRSTWIQPESMRCDPIHHTV